MSITLQENDTFQLIPYESGNVYSFSDFVYNSGTYLSRYFYNQLIEKIDNGYGFLDTVNTVLPQYIYVSEDNVTSLMSTPYQTVKKWDFDIHSNQTSITINDIDIISGEYLNIYGRYPTYLCLFNSYYDNFDIDRISYPDNGSILYIENDNVNYLQTNWKTNKLCRGNNRVYYGGLNLSNNLEILSYDVDESLKYHIDFLNGSASDINQIYSKSCSGTNDNPLYKRVVNKVDYPYFFNTVVSRKNAYYNYSIDINKDSLVFLQSPNNEIDGFAIFDYAFYNYSVSNIIDFIPNGYVLTSGTTYIYLSNLGRGATTNMNIEVPQRASVQNQYRVKQYQTATTLFSSGSVYFPASSTISHIQSVLSPLSPYGVVCSGNNVFDMVIYAKGDLDNTNLSNAMNFADFSYTNTRLDLTVRYNVIHTTTNTHGCINVSGDIVWQDNHGQNLVKYVEYNGTGIITNLYETPNHMGEIYSVQYNNSREKSLFTGNLVNGNTLGDYELRLFESGANIYDTGGNITGTYTNYIPTGQLLSNGIAGTGIQNRFNRKSLSYAQSRTSDLTCGESVIYPSSLLYYTGVSPNFDVGAYGVHGTFIYISGVD